MAQPSTSPPPSSRRGWVHGAIWCLGLGLLANAAVMLYRYNAPAFPFDTRAWAQPAPTERMLGARGIYMMPAQLGANAYGLYVLDVDAETVCVYRALPESSRFRLMAVRSFKYDRQLEDFNNESPTPKEVQKIVQQQKLREPEKKEEPK